MGGREAANPAPRAGPSLLPYLVFLAVPAIVRHSYPATWTSYLSSRCVCQASEDLRSWRRQEGREEYEEWQRRQAKAAQAQVRVLAAHIASDYFIFILWTVGLRAWSLRDALTTAGPSKEGGANAG